MAVLPSASEDHRALGALIHEAVWRVIEVTVEKLTDALSTVRYGRDVGRAVIATVTARAP